MTADGATRSGPEIRDYLAERLNRALVRPGMYGSGSGIEMALRDLLDDLAWIDRRENECSVQRWVNRRAWSNIGVFGEFLYRFGGVISEHDKAMALVYADCAHRWGYLAPARVLIDAEYERLRREAPSWASRADWLVADLLAEFGPPSVGRMSYNPRFSLSWGYVSGRRTDPLIAFDFWQQPPWHEGESPFGPEPVLRNVRWLEGEERPFLDGFIFTPIGQTLLLPPDADDEDYDEDDDELLSPDAFSVTFSSAPANQADPEGEDGG